MYFFEVTFFLRMGDLRNTSLTPWGGVGANVGFTASENTKSGLTH